MPEELLYYAYGSNLHPQRLGARIPSARLIGTATLSGYRLAFHKRGGDLSAKCDAFYTGEAQHQVTGALYCLSAAEKPTLDRIEGPGYAVHTLSVQHQSQRVEAFAYIAEADFIDDQLKPYPWYKEFVYLGARYHGFDETLLQWLNDLPSMSDPDSERHQRNEQILKLMR